MIRDPDRLSGRTFDVLVVGGGVYGLTIAYDAAQRGLAVALIDRADFGSGASFNHLRTIHGGLRYLQSMDFRRSRESVRERRAIARIAPHVVQPLPFALPLYRSLMRGKIAMRVGFLLDRAVGAGHNRGVAASHRLPGGRVYSRGGAIQHFPGLKRQGLTGAAVWHDYVTLEPDRLTISWALAAHACGATLVNYVEAMQPIKDGTQVTGVRARDVIGGRSIDIAAHITVNATGSNVDALLQPLGSTARVPLMRAMNLVTRRDAGAEALGGRGASGRNLFMVPWRDRALFGTWESDSEWKPGDAAVDERDVATFIGELNGAFPALDLTMKDVTLVHHGVVPASIRGNRVVLEGHEQIRDHAAEGLNGLLTVAGAKYTTARGVAERVTNQLVARLARPPVACRTATAVLPGGDVPDVGLAIAHARREHDEGLPTDTIPHLIAAYGSKFGDVLELANGRSDLKKRVAKDSPVIGAELVMAVRNEMAVTLADAMIRRTPVGALGYPGDDAAARGAAIVGAELGWSEEKKRREAESLKNFYQWLLPTAP